MIQAKNQIEILKSDFYDSSYQMQQLYKVCKAI